ncbi:putative secreted protein [Mycobacterium xenopi 4042]|uniref:Putative secreted protein n=1 Tax=Mycobacterium xenopi 4042 TaxID=1299334 RepID=X8ANZ0_MYCXE|nr:putative secreted protein [Mycobacterium xenopi 4042]
MSTKAIHRSAAPRARPSRSTAPTRAAGAGRGPARSNAGCTRRDHTRIDRTRQRGSSRGRQCPRCRAPVAAHPARSGRAGGVLRAHLAAPGRRADAGCRCQPAAVGRRLPRSRRHTTTNRRFADVRQADVLGQDERLLAVLRERLSDAGVSPLDSEVGVLVVAIGSSCVDANARTSSVAPRLAAGTCWAGAATAFATRPDRWHTLSASCGAAGRVGW